MLKLEVVSFDVFLVPERVGFHEKSHASSRE
jgi:hypothetical protein